jgi:hypothetical protein
MYSCLDNARQREREDTLYASHFVLTDFVVVFNCLDLEGKKYLSREEFERAARNYSEEKYDLDGFVTNIFTKVLNKK